jgi:hypothetical protein
MFRAGGGFRKQLTLYVGCDKHPVEAQIGVWVDLLQDWEIDAELLKY